MEQQVTHPEDSRIFIALSSLAFALLVVLVFSTPFVEMSGVVTEPQKAWRLYGYGLVGLLQAGLFLLRGWERSLRIIRTPIALFLLLCALSVAWTQHVDLTAKRLLLLTLVYGGIFAGVCDLGARRSLGVVRVLLMVTLAINVAVALAAPDIGIHTNSSTHLWRGVMAHKNIAGMLCAVTIILFAFDGGKIPIAARATVIAGALIFSYLAWSKTALITLPLAVAAGGSVALMGRRLSPSSEETAERLRMIALGLYGLVLVILIVATLQRDFLLSLTNDTTALTTRAAIWRPMIQFYLDHPLLGSGYGAYWDASAALVDSHTRNSELWKNVDQGHNGYLDVLVQLGLPGLAIALYAAFMWPVARSGALMRRHPQRAGLICALLVFYAIENFSESSLFADDTLGNAFLLIALAQLQLFRLRHSDGEKSRYRADNELNNLARLRDIREKRHHAVDS